MALVALRGLIGSTPGHFASIHKQPALVAAQSRASDLSDLLGGALVLLQLAEHLARNLQHAAHLGPRLQLALGRLRVCAQIQTDEFTGRFLQYELYAEIDSEGIPMYKKLTTVIRR